MRAFTLAGLGLGGCGGEETEQRQPLGPAPAGLAWQTTAGFSFLHPTDWQKEVRGPSPGDSFVAYTGPVTNAGVTPREPAATIRTR